MNRQEVLSTEPDSISLLLQISSESEERWSTHTPGNILPSSYSKESKSNSFQWLEANCFNFPRDEDPWEISSVKQGTVCRTRWRATQELHKEQFYLLSCSHCTPHIKCNSSTCHAQKFSDDWGFMEWCGRNNLKRNMAKTKGMVVNFSRSKSPPTPISILGEVMAVVESYRYIGQQIGLVM